MVHSVNELAALIPFILKTLFFAMSKLAALIYIIICQCPSVCPYAIYSLSFGPIWTLKVPMDFLGPGGGNKTICRVMGSKMKKKYY